MSFFGESLKFLNTLNGWQWAVLAAVPPAIVLLYFLKLRRQPLEVPSTFLWARTIEDLHVNSIWQRLRRNLLLLLQLLLILLAMLACLRPGWRGVELHGNRFIFVVDNSASMSATDASPTRLDQAKTKVLEMVDAMRPGDVAMLITFSDVARTELSYTDNRPALREKVRQIKPTNHSTVLVDALRAAATLANPGRTSQEGTNDVQVADALKATIYLFSDGGFADVPEFAQGNLETFYIPIGSDAPRNVGITAFSTDRNSERPGQLQAFGRLENCGSEDAKVEVLLYLGESLLDAAEVHVPADGGAGVHFELADESEGELRLQLRHDDHLAVDNVAYAPLNPPRPANVLVVTPSNPPLEAATKTDEATKAAIVTFAGPSFLDTEEYLRQAEIGAFDLIVYHQCGPRQMPLANTLFLGRLPPGDAWKAGPQGPVLITDVDRQHPLTQFVELGDVLFLEAFPVIPPEGGKSLIDMTTGSLLAIAPRQGLEDAVLGTSVLPLNERGQNEQNMTWHLRASFPVFFMNAFRYLGGGQGVYAAPSLKPGTPLALRSARPVDRITVISPDKRTTDVSRDGQNTFVYSQTEELGVYAVREAGLTAPTQQFAVNLFDFRESDLRVRETLSIGYEAVNTVRTLQAGRTELWKWLLFAGLCVLMLEWYVYNRRVYL